MQKFRISLRNSVASLQIAELHFNWYISFGSGALLIYLPPYSPDYKPIEEASSKIKAILQCNEKKLTTNESVPFLIHEATLSVTSDDTARWFHDCGYLDD